MSGWFCNPLFLLPVSRYPIFGYCTSPYMLDGSSRGAYIASQTEAMAHSALGPYGWTSRWGNSIQLNSYDPTLPPSTVMAFQRMSYDPTYVPALDPNLGMQGMPDANAMQQQLAQAKERGAAQANKDILTIKYQLTTQRVNAFATELTQLLKTEGLTDADKAEIAEVQRKVEELKKKIEEYAKTSADKETTTAIAEVEAMAGELIELKQSATKIAERIAAAKQKADQTDPADPTDQADPTDPTDPADPTDPTDPADPADPTDPAAAAEGMTGKEAQKAYNEKVRPYINKTILKDKNLSAADRKAIIDKTKEFISAKTEDKPRILQELLTLLSEVEERLKESASKHAAQTSQQAAEICSTLYTAANGFDWSWCGESDNEKTLKDTVYTKINEHNVIDVLDAWAKGDYNSRTGDSCLLETLFGEFQWNTSGIKKRIAEHFIRCLEKAAKAKGLYTDIMPYVSAIKGEMNCTFWSYEKIYNAFNSIHAILTNLETEEKEPKQKAQK